MQKQIGEDETAEQYDIEYSELFLAIMALLSARFTCVMIPLDRVSYSKNVENILQTITQKMADQERSDFCVVFTMSFARLNRNKR